MQPGQTTDPSQQTPPESQQQPLSESNPMPEQQFNQRQMAPESTQLQTVDMTQPASESLAVQETSQEAIQNSGGSNDVDHSAQEQPNWQFDEETDTAVGDEQISASAQSIPEVEWTASEYIAHEKNIGWYMLATLVLVAVGALIYLITRDLISPIVIFIMGMAFVAFAARKPRVLSYAISNTGVIISQKHYPFNTFKTFSIIEEGAVRSILLMPLRRFNLPIYIYYEPSDEPKIIEALSAHLPREDIRMNPVDNLMRKIRF